MEKNSGILMNDGDSNSFTIKDCKTEEEVKKYLSSPPVDCESYPGGFAFCNPEKGNIIISLSDSARWNEPNDTPQLPEATLADKLAEWGRNFMYNAKSGNNIWYALLGDKQLNPEKKVRLINVDYDISTKKGWSEFYKAFNKLLWITYRSQFLPLKDDDADYCDDKDESLEVANKKSYKSDNGWGCTIRVGQMALANGLVRYFTNNGQTALSTCLEDKILLDFWDNGIGESYPFSIQNFCALEYDYKKQPGQWLNQSMVATILQKLNSNNNSYKLQILLFIDGAFYRDQFSTTDSSEFKKIGYDIIELRELDYLAGKLVFISCSLGMKIPEPEYLQGLKDLFDFPELVGVMGGRKSEALFFVGYQDDDFLFLDPHFVQPTVAKVMTVEQRATYHCNIPKVVNYSKIDVSLCAVFYVTDDEENRNKFIDRLKKYSTGNEKLIHYYDETPNMEQYECL